MSLVLPGLGSITQGRWALGIAILAFGTGAFLATLWSILSHLLAVLGGVEIRIPEMLLQVGIGTALVVLAYVVDLLLVWLRRDHLVERPPT